MFYRKLARLTPKFFAGKATGNSCYSQAIWRPKLLFKKLATNGSNLFHLEKVRSAKNIINICVIHVYWRGVHKPNNTSKSFTGNPFKSDVFSSALFQLSQEHGPEVWASDGENIAVCRYRETIFCSKDYITKLFKIK